MSTSETPNHQVRFIRDDTPQFETPVYTGERYEDMVPDTLDIQERTTLAVNGLTGPSDPEKNHLLYFYAEFCTNPPSMRHVKSDVCQIKHMESLPLMRIASGESLNDEVDPIWMRTALQMIGPDGLAYWPSLPWGHYPDWCEPCPVGYDHYAMPFMNGRLIGAMTAYMLRDPCGPWDAEIRKIVDGLCSIAIDKGDYAYFPVGGFAPGEPRVRESPVPMGIFSSLSGWTITGLAQYHRVSGYQPAADLAGKLSRYLAYHGRYFGPNGEYMPNSEGTEEIMRETNWQIGPPPASFRIHFQHHVTPLLGVLDHALAADDRDLLDFVRRAFEWGRAKGNGLLGYFPENIDNNDEFETSETCEVAAMIAMALKLSAAGVGDYWDDADRWIRNQFAENQLLQSDWVYHMQDVALATSRMRIPRSAIDPITETCDRVPERNLGGFAGWPTANDWFIGHGSGIMMCCTGNGTRALYYIWEHILTHEDGVLSVNLLLNRPSKWADVRSHIPYTGQVDVSVKQPIRMLRLRIPEWVRPEEVSCVVNGADCRLEWEGRYALVGAVQAGDSVSMTFPISERSEEIELEKQRYSLTFRGNEVVDIYPRGRYCPLYQRSHYRQGGTRWRKMTRFVSDEEMYW